ncbi:MAG: AAA family ATPase [Oligoflexia bacterium]|nr:AAA family ATPase [Oligoflexia bacterium]
MSTFPTTLVHCLSERTEEQKWLVDQLWTVGAVGIIGGEPKCCKSFLALSLAIAVSSGVPCLGRYKVHKQGRVVIYAAEDAPHIVKGRLEGLSKKNNLNLDSLDIHAITVPSIRLDREEDQLKLKRTIEKLRPQLLILDPFVRLHRIDENASGEVAFILASLREIQRTYQTAIIIVHHSKKGATGRAGQGLRGSSEFHAWGDVNLYLRRDKNDQLLLSIEHRDAKSQTGIPLQITEENGSIVLSVSDENIFLKSIEKESINKKIEQLFEADDTIISFSDLRARVGARATNVSATLKEMVEQGILERVTGGYQRATN